MPWFVALVTTPSAGTGNVTAVVESFPSEAAFQKATGTTPAQEGVPGQTNAGFATKAAAQKAADAYNKSGAGRHATGAAPYNDSILAGTPGPIALGNLLHLNLSWSTVGNFLWRAAKISLGGVLLVAGLLKMTSLDQKALGVVGVVAQKLPGV